MKASELVRARGGRRYVAVVGDDDRTSGQATEESRKRFDVRRPAFVQGFATETNDACELKNHAQQAYIKARVTNLFAVAGHFVSYR